MIRGFSIGLVVSVALTLVLCKVVDSRRAATASAASASDTPRDTATFSTPDSAAELARIRLENDGLAKDIAQARTDIEKAIAAAKAAGPEVKGNPWKVLAGKLVAYMKGAKEDPGSANKNQDVMLEMIALMGKLGKEYGVTMDEAMMTPDGLPSLLLAALEGAEPPLTAAEREALAKAMAHATANWEEFEKTRDGMSRLEQKGELLRNSFGITAEMAAAVSPERAELMSTMQAFGNGLGGGLGGGFFSSHGPREQVQKEFSEQWAKTFKLEPSQAILLSPIVDNYLRSCDAATAEMKKQIAAGNMAAQSELMLKRVEAQIAAQKQIAREINLTDAQREALSGWATTYTYWDSPVKTPTEPDIK